MNNNLRIWGSLVILAVLIVGGIWVVKARHNDNGPEATEGRAVFAVTDDPTALNGVSTVKITIDKVEVQSAGSGWITLSDTPKEFDLMALKSAGAAEIVADADLNAATYNKIRLNIGKVVVATETKGDVEAKLPSDQMDFMVNVPVTAGETSTALIDFMLDDSLHAASNNQFILTPVVKLDVKTNATLSAGNKFDMNSGTTESSTTVGMDLGGFLKSDFMVTAKLDLIGETVHATTVDLAEAGVKINAAKALEVAKRDGKLETAASVQLTNQNGQKIWVVNGTSASVNTNIWVDSTSGKLVENTSAGAGNELQLQVP